MTAALLANSLKALVFRHGSSAKPATPSRVIDRVGNIVGARPRAGLKRNRRTTACSCSAGFQASSNRRAWRERETSSCGAKVGHGLKKQRIGARRQDAPSGIPYKLRILWPLEEHRPAEAECSPQIPELNEPCLQLMMP